MRRSIHSLFFLTGLLALSCSEEIAHDDSLNPSGEDCVVQFTVERKAPTKSILPGDIENRLDNAFVLVTSQDGYSRYQYFDFTQNPDSKSVEWRMPAGRDYTLYAVGNMGNILSSIPRTEEGFNMADFRFEVPPYAQMTAMPMAVCRSLSAQQLTEGSHAVIPISLERLMAQVVIRIDKRGITGGDAAQVLQSASLHLRQVARGLYPFRSGGSRALTDNDVFTGNTDYHEFSLAESWNLDSGEITLYVPENCQGQLLPGSAAQTDKSARNATIEALPQKGRLTYIEYASSKNGQADGVSGSLVYRGYLGSNETNDFSIERNRRYTATLGLTWDGFTWKADGWRIDRGADWNDGRRLAFLDANGNAIHYLKIHKKGSGEAYAYFDIAPGSGTAGRKDVASYPYGWYLTGNNATLSGHDGSADRYTVAEGVTVQCLGTAIVSGKAVTRLRFEASAAALVTTENAALRHQFGLHTMDGALHSDGLELDIEELPFQFNWLDNGIPNHIAQRGILRCVDPYTGNLAPDGVFHIKDGYGSKIRLANNGDGTATVSLVDDFSLLADAVYITDADGDRRCNVPLEGRVPWFECSPLSPATNYVDAQSAMRFTYCASDSNGGKSTDVLKVSPSQGAGYYLYQPLVEELLAPVFSSEQARLGHDRFLADDGSYTLYTHIHSYQGISALLIPYQKTFTADKARVSMNGHPDRGTVEAYFQAYNPWYWITTVAQGAVMNDYTLYHEPKGWFGQAKVGWEATPSHGSVEPASATYSATIGNAVVSSLRNLKFNASFQDGGGYLGSKVCTSNDGPYNVSYDYDSRTTYQLCVRLTDPVNYDWRTIGNYLYYDQGHYFSGMVWTHPQATDAARKGVVDECFRDAGNEIALSAWCQSEASAWEQAPAGVSASNPTAIPGLSFSVKSHSTSPNWTLNYSMAGLKEGDIISHNAGKIDVVLQIVNPYNESSPALDKKVAEAYVKLHLYIWSAAYGPTVYSQPYSPGKSHGWAYGAYPFAYTEGKTIHGLENAGYGQFFAKSLLKAANETNTTISTTELVQSTQGASTGTISRSINNRTGMATWRFRNDDAFSDSQTEAQRKAALMRALSHENAHGWSFIFKSASGNDGLNALLGSGTYFRQDETTLYYDPSGNENRYTYVPGGHVTTTDKLFVIHIGNSELRYPYYFDTANGFQ